MIVKIYENTQATKKGEVRRIDVELIDGQQFTIEEIAPGERLEVSLGVSTIYGELVVLTRDSNLVELEERNY